MFWKKILPGAIVTVILTILYYQKTGDPWFLYVMIPIFLLGSMAVYWFTKKKNGSQGAISEQIEEDECKMDNSLKIYE